MPSRVLLWVGMVAALAAASSSAAASRPLDTAIFDPSESAGQGLSLDRTRAAGATAVRLSVNWDTIVVSAAKPSDAADPLSESYRWTSLDEQILEAHDRGLDPFLSIVDAPAWALLASVPGAAKTLPDPVELGKFTRAAATRYSGAFEDLPRVRYWQVWNEPNLTPWLSPQLVAGKPFSPSWYRRMVNEVARAVKTVRADNLVIAGGTAPFRDITPEVQKVNPRWGPLTFMRELLCLSRSLRRTCPQKTRFDIWAHHPYTSGGPTHHAVLPDDVSLGDLPEMRSVLNAGVRTGSVVSRGPVKFWVTEFSWDSNKPDPYGVPTRLQTRWVAEALYRMWTAGVSLVTWFSLRDEPLATSQYQSGLYFRGQSLLTDKPKPALVAFRFPFVAFPTSNGVQVWGRTPAGRATRVLVEQQFRGSWKRLGTLQTNVHGIFQARYATHRTGYVRARTLDRGERAVPFSLKAVPDRFFRPFGGPPLEPPRRQP